MIFNKYNRMAFFVRSENEAEKIINMIGLVNEIASKSKESETSWRIKAGDMIYEIFQLDRLTTNLRGRRYDYIFATRMMILEDYYILSSLGPIIIAPIEFLIEKRMMIL